MCLSLSCHAEADLGSKGRKVRAHLLQATSLFLQKNEQRPQTHHYKASHRGQRPKLKQSFFLYTHLLQVNVPSPTSHHGGFRFPWMRKSVQPRGKTSISKVTCKHILSLLQKKNLEDPICFHSLLHYFLTSPSSLFIKVRYRVIKFFP